jgi:hypothetical protein
MALKMSPFSKMSRTEEEKLLGKEWCTYDKGVEDYLNINAEQLRSQKGTSISACNMTIYNNYKVDPRGSISILP